MALGADLLARSSDGRGSVAYSATILSLAVLLWRRGIGLSEGQLGIFIGRLGFGAVQFFLCFIFLSHHLFPVNVSGGGSSDRWRVVRHGEMETVDQRVVVVLEPQFHLT